MTDTPKLKTQTESVRQSIILDTCSLWCEYTRHGVCTFHIHHQSYCKFSLGCAFWQKSPRIELELSGIKSDLTRRRDCYCGKPKAFNFTKFYKKKYSRKPHLCAFVSDGGGQRVRSSCIPHILNDKLFGEHTCSRYYQPTPNPRNVARDQKNQTQSTVLSEDSARRCPSKKAKPSSTTGAQSWESTDPQVWYQFIGWWQSLC